ncbi:MAG: hypothetical protein PWP57_918 [Candidatus Atribacteria bacterium]|nr:hypothetical protein [Candidatus Atribacteria bacterium]
MAKTVLVTGAGRGIGKAIALEFAKHGYDVAIHHRKEPEGSAELAQQITDLGRRAVIVVGDLAEPDTPARVIDEVYDKMGGLSVLVNNAGITIFKPFVEMNIEQLEQCYKVDFRAPYLCAQRAAQKMIQNNIKGSIINITSVHQERTNDKDTAYGSMKAALARATESMAYELAPHGIRVNAIAPGLTLNDEQKNEHKSFIELIEKSIPMRRTGHVKDIAQAAVWLASDDASYITGVTLRVDGGLNLPMMQALIEGRQTFI